MFTRADHMSLTEPYQCSPKPSLLLDVSYSTFSSNLALRFASDLFSLASPANPSMHLSSLPFVPHALSTSLFLFWSRKCNFLSSTFHEAPHCTVSSSSKNTNICLSTLFWNTLRLSSPPPLIRDHSSRYKPTGILYFCTFRSLYLWISNWKTKRCEPKCSRLPQFSLVLLFSWI